MPTSAAPSSPPPPRTNAVRGRVRVGGRHARIVARRARRGGTLGGETCVTCRVRDVRRAVWVTFLHTCSRPLATGAGASYRRRVRASRAPPFSSPSSPWCRRRSGCPRGCGVRRLLGRPAGGASGRRDRRHRRRRERPLPRHGRPRAAGEQLAVRRPHAHRRGGLPRLRVAHHAAVHQGAAGVGRVPAHRRRVPGGHHRGARVAAARRWRLGGRRSPARATSRRAPSPRWVPRCEPWPSGCCPRCAPGSSPRAQRWCGSPSSVAPVSRPRGSETPTCRSSAWPWCSTPACAGGGTGPRAPRSGTPIPAAGGRTRRSATPTARPAHAPSEPPPLARRVHRGGARTFRGPGRPAHAGRHGRPRRP